jgi:hypothetical protein
VVYTTFGVVYTMRQPSRWQLDSQDLRGTGTVTATVTDTQAGTQAGTARHVTVAAASATVTPGPNPFPSRRPLPASHWQNARCFESESSDR